LPELLRPLIEVTSSLSRFIFPAHHKRLPLPFSVFSSRDDPFYLVDLSAASLISKLSLLPSGLLLAVIFSSVSVLTVRFLPFEPFSLFNRFS